LGRVVADRPGGGAEAGRRGAPGAAIVLDLAYAEAAADLRAGEELIVLTWLHRADRETLAVHPRGDLSRQQQGVFSTRSPSRPNPIGLHRVRLLGVDSARLRVADLEALDGTPVLDIKPVLGDVAER
jgi:tRNA-Thr(GGU) m(6)t(6)A37 methyltransferase TsaA